MCKLRNSVYIIEMKHEWLTLFDNLFLPKKRKNAHYINIWYAILLLIQLNHLNDQKYFQTCTFQNLFPSIDSTTFIKYIIK